MSGRVESLVPGRKVDRSEPYMHLCFTLPLIKLGLPTFCLLLGNTKVGHFEKQAGAEVVGFPTDVC